jgi:hypothetical protein
MFFSFPEYSCISILSVSQDYAPQSYDYRPSSTSQPSLQLPVSNILRISYSGSPFRGPLKFTLVLRYCSPEFTIDFTAYPSPFTFYLPPSLISRSALYSRRLSVVLHEVIAMFSSTISRVTKHQLIILLPALLEKICETSKRLLPM